MQASFYVRAAFEMCKTTISEGENQSTSCAKHRSEKYSCFFQPNALQISYWYAGLKQQGKSREQKGSMV